MKKFLLSSLILALIAVLNFSYTCPGEGVYVDPYNNCRFTVCVRLSTGELFPMFQSCPDGYYFDELIGLCASGACGITGRARCSSSAINTDDKTKTYLKCIECKYDYGLAQGRDGWCP